MHPRNRHTGRYDFKALVALHSDLVAFVYKSAHGEFSGEQSIDFANPKAVKALNQALLKQFYGVSKWDVPEGFLCPPIPGRSDYIHHIADLLAACNGGEIPRGDSVHVLDIGVGANCIYPIIGRSEYGWNFVGTDIDPIAMTAAQKNVDLNPTLKTGIELRLQKNPPEVFHGIIQPNEKFDLVVCNPPFHSSLAEASEGSQRKWNNLGRGPKDVKGTPRKSAPILNFGGKGGELWCPGGEVEFITQMIQESVKYKTQVLWFSALVSREAHLPHLFNVIDGKHVADSRMMEMEQGQKKSRVITWSFMTPEQQEVWFKEKLAH